MKTISNPDPWILLKSSDDRSATVNETHNLCFKINQEKKKKTRTHTQKIPKKFRHFINTNKIVKQGNRLYSKSQMNITNLWNQAPRKEPNQTGSWKNTFWDKLQRPRIHRGRGNQKNQGSSSSLTFSNPFFFFFSLSFSPILPTPTSYKNQVSNFLLPSIYFFVKENIGKL